MTTTPAKVQRAIDILTDNGFTTTLDVTEHEHFTSYYIRGESLQGGNGP